MRRLETTFASLRLLAGRARASLLRMRGAGIGAKVSIGKRVEIRRPWCIRLGQRVEVEHDVFLKVVNDEARLSIGEYSFVGRGGEIDVAGSVEIGSHSLLAPSVFITDHHHNIEASARIDAQGLTTSFVRIGHDVWIGANAVILPGVTIGDGSVIGAGAVVTRDVPAYTVVAGVPARPLRERKGVRPDAGQRA